MGVQEYDAIIRSASERDWPHYSMANGSTVGAHSKGTGYMVKPQEAREHEGASLSLLWQRFQELVGVPQELDQSLP